MSWISTPDLIWIDPEAQNCRRVWPVDTARVTDLLPLSAIRGVMSCCRCLSLCATELDKRGGRETLRMHPGGG